MNNENKTLVMLSVSTTGLRTHQRACDELILWNPRIYTPTRALMCAHKRARVRACGRVRPQKKGASERAFPRARFCQVSRHVTVTTGGFE